MATPRLGITYVTESQAQKATTVDAAFDVLDAAVTRISGDTMTGQLKITRTAVATGNPAADLWIIAPADTGMTAGTEAQDVLLDFSATRQFATGALATQRALRVLKPTYGFVGASVVTTAATVAISGAPVAGTNATITNSYAFWVEDGSVQIGSQAVAGTLGISRAAATSGTPSPLIATKVPADTGLANVNFPYVNWDFSANTISLTGGGGSISGWDNVTITAGTIAAAAAQTISQAATVHIVGNIGAGTNVTITNSCALQVQGRICQGNNVAASLFAAHSIASARNSAQYNLFYIQPINSGNLLASTESSLAVFDPNGTITWATGNLAVQAEMRILAPTYAAVGASIFTGVATVRIAGAPAAGANMTLTNSYALWLQAGGLRVTGHVCCDGGSVVGAAAGANAGASPPAPVVTANGNDTRGNITFGTGTAAAAGAQVAVTFAAAYSAAATPVVTVVSRNAATQALGLYISAVSTSGFTLSCTNAPASSQGNTVFSFDFHVLG